MKRQSRTEGFTIVEASIAVAIGALLTGVVLSIGVETMKFSSYADSDFAVQYEANRAFDRVSEVLRKVGWNNSAGATYPHVLSAGAEIQFRMLQDLDGNGYTFDGSTGDLEWGSELYTIRREADGTLGIFDASDTLQWTCGRSIQSVTFETVVEDSLLHYQEIRVTIVASRNASDGTPISYTASGSVHMRN